MMGFRNGSVIPYRINGSEAPWYGLVIDHPACRPNTDEHLLDCPGVHTPPQLGLHMCGKWKENISFSLLTNHNAIDSLRIFSSTAETCDRSLD